MISEEYAEFNGTTVADAVGKHVTEVVENTRMHVVAKDGRRRDRRAADDPRPRPDRQPDSAQDGDRSSARTGGVFKTWSSSGSWRRR